VGPNHVLAYSFTRAHSFDYPSAACPFSTIPLPHFLSLNQSAADGLHGWAAPRSIPLRRPPSSSSFLETDLLAVKLAGAIFRQAHLRWEGVIFGFLCSPTCSPTSAPVPPPVASSTSSSPSSCCVDCSLMRPRFACSGGDLFGCLCRERCQVAVARRSGGIGGACGVERAMVLQA
jgi:hypothetical protein